MAETDETTAVVTADNGAFNPQPTLCGELVTLRPLRADDFDALYAVASDPLIWEQHPVSNRHEESVFREFFRDALASGGALIVHDAVTDEVIGSSRYHGFDPTASEVEIGWTFLARKYWGGRYNGEMKRLMIEHAFQYVDRVGLTIGPSNIRSQRAAEKIGAVRTGTSLNERGEERVVYSIRRPDARNVLETPRLVLRRFSLDDAPFVLEALNDADFLRYIGDRGVRTVDQARDYIRDRLLAGYELNGFGMYLVVRKKDGVPIGMCGLVKRPTLDDVDLGYAFMPAFRGQGYAREAASATMSFAHDTLALTRLVAIVTPENADSIRLLEAMSMTFERELEVDADGSRLLLYACSLERDQGASGSGRN